METKTRAASKEYQWQYGPGISQLLNDFDPQNIRKSGLLKFEGVGERDVYNITAPFIENGHRLIAGRVEPRDDEFASETVFFVEDNGTWRPHPHCPTLPIQDPFVCRINGELIVGGVDAWPTGSNSAAWQTAFWRGSNLTDLEYWTVGPLGMKGIRLVQCRSSIGVFTRPQGEIGGRGTIGFTKINHLNQLNEDVITNAPLLESLFAEDEWGGVNHAQLLTDGTIGALGHIAKFEVDNSRSYYGMRFRLDPDSLETSDLSIIATRKQFPAIKPKRVDLVNVLYPGGWESTDTVDLIYGGGGDSCGVFAYVDRLFS